MDTIKNIIDRINDAKSIAIIYHVHADGDAVGSALALSFAFSRPGKSIDIFGEEEVQKTLQFLPGSQNVLIGSSSDVYDLAIALDCGDSKRLGSRIDIFNNAGYKINIDHHKGNSVDADINLVDSSAAASGEIVYDIIKAAGVQIDQKIADNLYTAICTDCGSFKYSNTSAKTHIIAAELLNSGVKPDEISRKIYESLPFPRIKLLGKILDTMELCEFGKISIMHTSFEQINQYGAKIEDLENIANYGLMVEDVEVSIFLRGLPNGNTKVSTRSKSYFECCDFTRAFGGGGHSRAAGCELKMSIEESKKALLEKLNEIGL